jgi:hypothetical protein
MSNEIVTFNSGLPDTGPLEDKALAEVSEVSVSSNPFSLTKTWLGYIKTKQFWIVLVFG